MKHLPVLHREAKVWYATDMLPFRDYNPSRTFPLVTISLIALNVLVFLYMLTLQAQGDQVLLRFVQRAAVIPLEYTTGHDIPPESIHPIYLTVFTAMFMHAGFLHLAGNMLYLWIFGNNIEDIMGHGRFLIFYLLCGVIATATHIASDPTSPLPSLGASGAIAGVLGAYLVKFPRAQVDTCVFFIFITVIRLPAIIVLAGWFILQLFQGVAALSTGASHQGGTAFWAHIGGFIAGMIFVNLFQKRRNIRYNY
ncbi:MAG TPA: rhomboid family intramembrane serine protease [Armatimonadota bacterium]|nr:rhomboid family intramembrane serine protease [Armatimonadota bacterium]